MAEGHHDNRELLRSRKSLQEILEVAIRFEETAHRFYHDLTPKVSKRLRYLVEELAGEEQEHVRLFTELLENPEITATLPDLIATPPGDHRFSDAVHLPDLGENPDDQAILQFALAREHAAMEQYGALAEELSAGPTRDLFEFLCQQETLHKRELEKLYYEVVHSGGV